MKHLKKENQKTLEGLRTLLNNNNARLIKFEIFHKAFGDVIIEVEYLNNIHIFSTDRGDIYHNGRGLRNNSYHIAGENDTFRSVVKVIEEVLFTKV